MKTKLLLLLFVLAFAVTIRAEQRVIIFDFNKDEETPRSYTVMEGLLKAGWRVVDSKVIHAEKEYYTHFSYVIESPALAPAVLPTTYWPNEKLDADYDAWLKVEWQKVENKNSPIIHGFHSGERPLFANFSGKKYEFGLRSDGLVVWRERK